MKFDADNFEPLRQLMLVQRETPEERTGGIVIPESWRQYGWRACVLKVGPDVERIKAGDDILFLKEFTVLPFKDRALAITDSDNVLARLEVAAGTEVIKPMNGFVMILPDATDEQDDGIALPDKSKKSAKTGEIADIGFDCNDVAIGWKVWFEDTGGMVNVIENGKTYKIIKEDDILCRV